MRVNKDFEELLQLLNAVRAHYLLVGAYAVIYYTEPRYTKDIDFWVDPTAGNAEKVYLALKKFGAPMKDLKLEDLSNPDIVFHMGVEPNRVDILMDISGVSNFEKAWKNRKTTKYGRQTVHILGLGDLIKAKKAANRPQDRIDVDKLEKRKRKGPL